MRSSQVRNVLPTAVSKAEIEVIVPVNISARGDVVPLLESPTLQVIVRKPYVPRRILIEFPNRFPKRGGHSPSAALGAID